MTHLQVRPRRLGTRGNSRYCYAGLQKRVKLEEPTTPDCIVESKMTLTNANSRDNHGGGNASVAEEAAMVLILEWAEGLFKEKLRNNDRLRSFPALAMFLIDQMYVDSRSLAAQALKQMDEKSGYDMDCEEEDGGAILDQDFKGPGMKQVNSGRRRNPQVLSLQRLFVPAAL